jgi:outer membrane receptor protein involved in Fe transport
LKKLKIYYKILILVITLIKISLAQSGSIGGLITDSKTQKAVADVIVKIDNSPYSTKTDKNGMYLLKDIPPGSYYIIFIKKNYFTLVIPTIQVKKDHKTKLNTELYAGNEKEFLFLEIGGIQVTADRELLSEEPETVFKISSGEIEHMQANSLADVLNMIPGNEKKTNMGLQNPQRVGLRTFGTNGGDNSALFGTKIIIDDVPQSNNANLQTGVGVNYGSKVQNTAETQIDLRQIAAENIKDVKVISGASSVEYGDQTQGLIIVRTKSFNIPTRLKLKTNPDTKEANLMGSFNLFSTAFSYNLNYGYSIRDIRIKGDEYHRINGMLKSQNYFSNGVGSFDQRFSYSRKIEDDNDPSDPYGVKAYNRDHHFSYSHILDYKINNDNDFYMRNYVNYVVRNSWKHKLETVDFAYVSTLMNDGIMEGVLIDPVYYSDVSTTGNEWSFGSKIKYTHRRFFGQTLHRFLAGIEYQNDMNNGPGKSFNILMPPGGRLGWRPRPFDDIPGVSQFSLFFEDRITGTYFLPYIIYLGFRLDTYNPTGVSFSNLFSGNNFIKSEQGTFFNPRLGIKIKATKNTQIRFNYSKTSKTPPIASIYPEYYYLDSYDYTIRQPDSALVTLVNTKVFPRENPNLKAYQSQKFELGVDQQVGNFGLSLVGYYQKTSNSIISTPVPYMYNRYFWPNWPDEAGKTPIESITTVSSSYSYKHNLGWNEYYGLEFSLRTHRIKALNMRFAINGQYKFVRFGKKYYKNYGSPRNYEEGDTLSSGWVVPEDMKIIPYYTPFSNWRQNVVVNYSVDYISKLLGIWFTLRAQQVFLERSLSVENPKLAADGYYRDNQHIGISEEESKLMELDRSYHELSTTVDKSKPQKWLFSLVVSKSIYKSAEVSFFVENIFNDPAYYYTRSGYYSARNPEIFWGITFSTKLDDIF